MSTISDFKGFSYPSPTGVSSVVGNMPWHFATEHLCISYESDPEAVAKYLPEPLKPSNNNPAQVIIDFGKWYCLWDEPDMPTINPERTSYNETVIWIGCSYQGQDARFCVQTWVDKDFSLVRGLIMGFNKKIGETYKTTYHPLNPGMPKIGPGAGLSGYVASHGERLMQGGMKIEKEISFSEIPEMMRLGQINLRYFPSMEPDGKPSVCELLQLEATDIRTGCAYTGSGHIELLPSHLEEHTNLKVVNVTGGYYFENGCTIVGGKVLHNWV